MKRWTYASQGGLRFPVQYGDRWTAQTARAQVRCEDVLEQYALPASTALVFTDPPWTQALVTQCYRQSGVSPERSYEEINRAVILLAASAAAPCYIEGPEERADSLVRWFQDAGAAVVLEQRLLSGKYDKGVVVAGSWQKHRPPDVSGINGEQLAARVIAHLMTTGQAREGDVVVDPMCGPACKTGVLALRAGLRFLGSDINPRCVSAALTSLGGDAYLQQRRAA